MPTIIPCAHTCVPCHAAVHAGGRVHTCVRTACTCAVPTCTMCEQCTCVPCGCTQAAVCAYVCAQLHVCDAFVLSLPPPVVSGVKAGGAGETQGQYGREVRKQARLPGGHPSLLPTPCLARGDTGWSEVWRKQQAGTRTVYLPDTQGAPAGAAFPLTTLQSLLHFKLQRALFLTPHHTKLKATQETIPPLGTSTT